MPNRAKAGGLLFFFQVCRNFDTKAKPRLLLTSIKNNMKHTNPIAIKILRKEYADYDENTWHYDREYRMLIEAISKVEKNAILLTIEEKEFSKESKCKHENIHGVNQVISRCSDCGELLDC